MTSLGVPSTVAATMAWQWKCRVDEVCERFEDAWAAGSLPCLEEYLSTTEVPESRRAALLAELLKLERELRQKRGEKPGASEYLARFPGHAMVVKSVFGEDRVGEYDLIAPIGEGGMGVVYHARHRRIGREVALKMIRPYCLDDSSAVDRFRLEAQLAARLDHEHIVTVYEAGQADGQHFYAMRYIVGQSLSEVIGKKPIDEDRAARYLEQVARAVDFAHTHDVLHRDLKPRNILIDSSDRAFVTDFGLAKILNVGTGATRTDDRLGTPPYMSPEQVRDPSRAGVASDVYSLGATLYEALTGRAPFSAENALEIYRQVLDDEPVPPRTLNPRCSRDIETICLKCLDKDPARRYASALQIAEDLRRFQNRDPIQGRRVGAFERARKWSRRHPTSAALIVVSGLALVAVAGVIQTRRNNANLEQSYQRSRAKFDNFIQSVDVKLNDQPVLRSELLEIALTYYDDFLRQHGDEPDLADELAGTYSRVARLNSSLGKRPGALKAQEQALTLRRKLEAQKRGDRRQLASMADTLHEIGILHQAMGNRQACIDAYREALTIREQLIAADPSIRAFLLSFEAQSLNRVDRALVSDLARSHGYIGDWEREGGLLDKAKASYLKAQELRERLVFTDSEDLLAKFQLGRSYGNEGILNREDGNSEGAIAAHRNALELQQALVAVGPEAAKLRLEQSYKASGKAPEVEFDDFRSDLASSHNALGVLHSEAGLKEKAIEQHDAALTIYEALAAAHPGLRRWDADRGWTATYLGELKGSKEDLDRGRSIFENLLTMDSPVPRVRAGLARNQFALGSRLVSEADKARARGLLETALQSQAVLLNEQPRNFDFQRDLERTKKALAELDRR